MNSDLYCPIHKNLRMWLLSTVPNFRYFCDICNERYNEAGIAMAKQTIPINDQVGQQQRVQTLVDHLMERAAWYQSGAPVPGEELTRVDLLGDAADNLFLAIGAIRALQEMIRLMIPFRDVLVEVPEVHYGIPRSTGGSGPTPYGGGGGGGVNWKPVEAEGSGGRKTTETKDEGRS